MAQDRSSCEHSSACSAVVIVVADCRTGNLKEKHRA
jgi:hypothetical protein